MNVALLKEAYGVISWSGRTGWSAGSAPQIRREGQTHVVSELVGSYFNQFRGAVAPSGTRVVYFGQTENGPWALYLLDSAHPSEQRQLLALPHEAPGSVTWSSDETAIAFTVQDDVSVRGFPPAYSALRRLDLTTRNVSEVARVTGGNYYDVLGWNSATETLAAAIAAHGRPLLAYVVIHASVIKSTAIDGNWYMYGSPDARTVLGIRCDQPADCSLWTWPLGDFAARADQHFTRGLSVALFGWRPASDDVGLFVTTGPNGDAAFELWSPRRGRRTLYRIGSSTPPVPFFRADGSALFVPTDSGTIVIDISTGDETHLPLPTPNVPDERVLPVASILLDSP